MPIKTQTPSQDQVNELRNLFNQKYESDPPADPFHPVDIDRIRNEDIWCVRFLEMYDLDMNECLKKLWETCIWRQQSGANDLNESNLRPEYLNDGVVFTRNSDVDGKPLLIFKTKLHVKGGKDMDEVMRVVVYWVERIQREKHMSQVTIVFDMAGTGIGNMDLDFVKRIIELFKQYYPNALNYILIFEMAWVLNAAFKIIKGLLPAKALEILKMISKKDINTYIDQDNCLTSWGGNDGYEFEFVPEQVQQQKPAATSTVKANGAASDPAEIDRQGSHGSQGSQGSQDKKVHFANSSPTRMPQMTDFEDIHTPQDHDMLRISPNEFITFARGEDNESCVDITCISKFPVTYKIQTTSPEKFRVRPRCGVLHPGETISVSILLKPEQQLTEGSKDKFLVMCIPVPQGVDMSPSSQQIADVWKQKASNSPDVEQHRLCCIYKGAGESMRNGYGGHTHGESPDGKPPGSIIDLSKHAKQLEKQLRFTQILQCVTLVFLLVLSVAVVYLLKLQMSDGTTLEDAVAEEAASAEELTFSATCGRKV